MAHAFVNYAGLNAKCTVVGAGKRMCAGALYQLTHLIRPLGSVRVTPRDPQDGQHWAFDFKLCDIEYNVCRSEHSFWIQVRASRSTEVVNIQLRDGQS